MLLLQPCTLMEEEEDINCIYNIHKIINLPPPSFIYYPKYRLTGFHLYKLADFPKITIPTDDPILPTTQALTE
jgi:hypothetical protein